MTKGKIHQLQRERDEAKKAFDDVLRQREGLIGECDRVTQASGRAQDALQAALPYGDVVGAQAARTQFAELRTRREELLSLITALGARQSLLQRQYGDAFDRHRHAIEDAQWMKNRAAVRRRQLARAQSEDGPAVEAIRADLLQCEDRFLALTGELLSTEDAPAAA